MQGEFWPSTGPACDDMTTCGPSHPETLASGALTSSREGSLAKTSATLGRGLESLANDLACGLNMQGWFAFFDPDSCSWKTCQRSLFPDEGLMSFSEIWPRWGLMRSGHACRRRRLVRLIRGNDSGLLPTQKAALAAGSKGGTRANGKPRSDLRDHTGMVPTPTASMSKRGYSGQAEKSLLCPSHAGGPINPEWIEHLMGFPIGWTDLEG